MSTELIKRQEVKAYLSSDELFKAVDDAMPKHIDRDRFLKTCAVNFNKLPKLQLSTKNSIYDSILKLAYLGLFPDGRLAYLIPYQNKKAGTIECQAQVDYKGYVELAYRSKQVLSIHADVIYEGDDFQYDLGCVTKHVPWAWRKDKPDKKGKCLGAYCIVKMVDAEKHEVMDVEQLENIRRRSKSANDGPWVTDTDEMRKKTVFRRASKWIPISPEVQQGLAMDDDTIDVQAIASSRSVSIDALRLTEQPVVEDFVIHENEMPEQAVALETDERSSVQ
jgi:recombination protein RecT